MVWAAMMTRKMMILIAAVLAPLAFSGATADITRSWVRRWIEFVAAMIVSKLLLVIILSVGVSVLNGAGQAGSGPTQVFTQLSAGCLILLMGGLAPWVAIRMFHFAGDTLYAAHATAAQGSAGARSVVAAPRKVSSAQWQARSLMSSTRGHTAWGSGAGGSGQTPPAQQSGITGGPARATTGASVTSTAPATAAGAGGSTAAVGVGTTGAAGAGTAAAGSAAGPAAAAAAAPAVVAAGTLKAANAARGATIGAALGAIAETPSEPAPSSRAPSPAPPPTPKLAAPDGPKRPGVDP
jgi:type IV secretion system protein TrbL